jgi:acyl-CoA thioesterase FadM
MEQISFNGCFGCGQNNDSGLKATFRTLKDGGVEGVFIAAHHHCGYKDSVHVGPLVGFLSEAMGRLAFGMDLYYLTHTLSVIFRCAVSPGVKIRAFATMKRHSGHHLTAEAKMYGPGGELIADAEGKFVLLDRPEVKRRIGKPAGSGS